MKKNNQKLIIFASIIMILSFIIFYVGQFLFSPKDISSAETSGSQVTQTSPIDVPKPFPIEYKRVSITINGHMQEIFTLEFDPLDKQVEFKPVLSFDNIFGFEKISDISSRTGAYAAINGGFFYEYGEPVGMVAIDGKVFMASTGYAPVLVIDNSGASFKKIQSQLSFSINSKKININKLNGTGLDGDTVLYSSDYGSTNRAKTKNTSIRVENNTVTAITKDALEVALKKSSQLISFFGEKASLPGKLGLNVGDTIDVKISPQFEGKYQAYECGSMIVKNGLSVSPDKDRWIGTLKNRDPRTAIGIKENGRLVLIVVDGRQPGYSSGLTGKELADYLIKIGVKDAAMLDGGATSQMFVNGVLKNKPSDRGIPRPVAGAFILKVVSRQ